MFFHQPEKSLKLQFETASTVRQRVVLAEYRICEEIFAVRQSDARGGSDPTDERKREADKK
ncbi:MAG: hypothetical protein HBSAPP04_27310 [Ignavibacteriaceae bacterium]|nr:MAG: hypothetical protein HBSAPP04_27310 [Ignavibacteriaceae bacterium]